jgi:NAD-dependent dihydropyrimidine dehydrogenase PreA subunit
MATMITSDCINCGACEPECPNNAISQGDPVYVIDPQLCTECVGFHDYEACAAVCPVDVCVTDPNNIESEEVLIARARALHPETDFGNGFQSRFRKAQGDGAAAATDKAAVAEPKAAPVQTAAAKPESTPASPASSVAVPVPVAATAAPAVKAAAPAVAPKPVAIKAQPRPKKTFAKELPISFEEAEKEYAGQRSHLTGGVRLAVILLQPVIGALPHGIKKRLELAMQTPLFTAAGSTAVNIVHNAVLYPLALITVAALMNGPEIIFSQDINKYILIGLLLAGLEGVFRLKDGIFRAKPATEMKFLASFYGAPLGVIAAPFLERYTGLVRDIPVPVQGFYSEGFVDKVERERRYGNVYTVADRGKSFLVRMEFPRYIPDIGIADRERLPDEMPDYDYDLVLGDEELIVKGKCTDENVRKISSSIGAFPPEFTTVISLHERITGFVHHFDNKLLEVVLVKA